VLVFELSIKTACICDKKEDDIGQNDYNANQLEE
jgi:hypothetical protein